MSERHDLQKPDYGRYSPHEEPPVRKVTIQQKVVQPLNTSVLTTNNSDSFRRYPTVVSHNPSGRGHRGKNWAKPSRGVVAHIVKDLDRGVARHNVDSNEFGERRKSDDTMGPGKYSLDPEQRKPNQAEKKGFDVGFKTVTDGTNISNAGERNKRESTGYVESKVETKAKHTEQNKTGLPPIVPPKPKRLKPEANIENSRTETPKTQTDTNEGKSIDDERLVKAKMSLRKVSEIKVEKVAKAKSSVGSIQENTAKNGTRKAENEKRKAEGSSVTDGKGVWENALEELKEKISERKVEGIEKRKQRTGFKIKEKEANKTEVDTVFQSQDLTTFKTIKDEQTAPSESKTNNFGNQEKTSKKKPLVSSSVASETSIDDLSSSNDDIRTAQYTSERVTKYEATNFRSEEKNLVVNNFQESQSGTRNSNSPSWIDERELWEKAVKELELVISDKELVIDNLSNVNRKLSEDIEYYEGTFRDWKRREKENDDVRQMAKVDREEYQRVMDEHDRRIQELELRIKHDQEGYQRIIEERDKQIQGLKLRIAGDKDGYQRIIDEREGQIRELEMRITGDKEGYQRIINQREGQIRELESKIQETKQREETKARNSLELSHGSQNVLKTLGLKREKVALENRVEELQERIKFYESTSQNQQENNIVQEIPSMLYKFRDSIETQLQVNAKVVDKLEEKLKKCVENFQTLTKFNMSKENTFREPEILKERSEQMYSNVNVQEARFPNEECLPMRDSIQQNTTSEDVILPKLDPEISSSVDTETLNPAEIAPYLEKLGNLEAELQKERLINDELMEKIVDLEDLNNDYEDSIKSLEARAKDIEDLREQNDDLRGRNEGLVNEVTKLKENLSSLEDQDSNGVQNDNTLMLETQARETKELQEKLDEDEALIEELREKIVEDEELIEELRANCQREEKWNREMQRNYEWELSTSATKDDRIEEFQECLWAREKMVQELQEQLDFEDKRYEELLEKLIFSQKETEDFQEMCKDLKKKLEDSEKRIKEFCDQNDRDAVVISTLTSENKKLRSEVDGLVKVRRNLEEDLERANGCLEAVEADKENFLTRQESEVKKLSDELEDKEYTNKGKDEVIEMLQENVIQLSANVQEMEFKMEEGKVTLEEDLKKAKTDIVKRDKHLVETLEKYKELQEVCKSLRERISEKEGDVSEREAAMARQRETVEGLEKEIENLRKICGENSTPLNDKPELVYTEAEMDEVNESLEQERTLSDILRKQISFLENETEESKRSAEESKTVIEEKELLIKTKMKEIKEHERLREKTQVALNNANIQLSSTKEELNNTKRDLVKIEDELNAKRIELEENKTSTTILQVDLTELNTKYHLLEAIKDNAENELQVAEEKLKTIREEIERVKVKKEDLMGANVELKRVNETMKTKMEELEMEVNGLRMKLYKKTEELEATQTKSEQPKSEVYSLGYDMKELQDECWVKGDSPIQEHHEYKLRSEITGSEVVWRSDDQHESEVTAQLVGVDEVIVRDIETQLESERYVSETELNDLKEECKEILDENNKLKLSINEMEGFYEDIGLKNRELQRKVEKLTDKWLKSEERLRQAQINNVNLRYTLDEYISQSQEQIRHLKNHEREVATLTEHIHEMDVIVQGFKTALLEAVEKEKNSEEREDENEPYLNRTVHLKENGETANAIIKTSTEKAFKNNGDNTIGPKPEPSVTPATGETNERSVSDFNPHGSASKTDEESSTQRTVPAPLPNKDSNHDDVSSRNSQSGIEFMKAFLQKIQAAKIPKNVILVLIFLILVFCLGCTNSSVISRKYLFVFANSFISLIFFALWVSELDRNKKYKAVEMIFGENLELDGHELPHVRCGNCGKTTAIQRNDLQHYANIKSSFQELHEKFLEAVENSSKNTLPIQELYNKYEKLKDEVEIMRKERLDRDIMLTSVDENDEISKNDKYLPEKWNKAATILGKTFVIILLCEVLYIRGINFLPSAVNLVSFLLSLVTFSYFYETMYVETTSREEPCVTLRETELEQEIHELNHIIEKEHELVTTQREAIKVLEKRLRKEFEKRIKQKNALLKKLKFKGKLEDLRELLDNDEQEEDKKYSSANQVASVNPAQKAGSSEERIGTDINCNSQPKVMNKNETRGFTLDNNVQGGFNEKNMDNLSIYMDTDGSIGDNESIEGLEEHNISEKLQEIMNKTEKQSLDFEFIFSPMLFFLGLPLTGILMLCGYITLSFLMFIIQGALILKETKYIKTESLPKIVQEKINPILMDSVIVIYTCVLAVFMQCTQSIMVMITCAIVELAVHWWTSYKLAKKDDVLQEIALKCLDKSKKHK